MIVQQGLLMSQADINWAGWFTAQLEWFVKLFVKGVWFGGFAGNTECVLGLS